MLRMCIRAIDYCPPVDITFGDFLRAVVADLIVNPDDTHGYRVVLSRLPQWGIYPRGRSSLSTEALLWPTCQQAVDEAEILLDTEKLRSLFFDQQRVGDPDGESRGGGTVRSDSVLGASRAIATTPG